MKTITLSMLLLLSACAVDVGDEATDEVTDEDQFSEAEASLTAPVTCTSSYVGSGTCTATPPAGWTGTVSWTISGFNRVITSTGTYTASWLCSSGTSAKITAVGIGYTTVRCKAL